MMKRICLVLVLLTFVSAFASSVCAQGLKPSKEYIDSVNKALAASTDMWGEEVLARPNGPTYDSLKDKLNPLMHLFKRYSESEIYYLPFGAQDTVMGGIDYALHYADGGEIVSRRSEVPPAVIPPSAPAYAGKRMTIFVGADGRERYGSHLARLGMATLASGYLPILKVEYTDASSVHYTEESFATRVPQTRSLVSLVRLTAKSSTGTKPVQLRVHLAFVNRTTPPKIEDESGLRLDGNRIVDGSGNTFLLVSPGATLQGSDVIYKTNVAPGHEYTVYLVRLNEPSTLTAMDANGRTYNQAREQVSTFWNRKLKEGATFEVPEPYAMDAQRNLLIQNLQMNILYSIGNPYEVPYNAEGHDSVQALGLFGFLPEYRAGLESFLKQESSIYEKGERLVHAADYYFLTRDRSFIEAHQSEFQKFVSEFVTEMSSNDGLLRKEPGGTDISGNTLHYNINHQAVAWRGWRDMLEVWRELGGSSATPEREAKAAELRRTIAREARASSHRYPDGSLYIPNEVRENNDFGPFDPINATKEGAYWELVATDGFASGLYGPAQNEAILKYLHNHGGIMLGLIRFNYLSTPVGKCAPTGLPGYEVQGDDNAYAPPYFKMLADNGERDRLVLSFYGKLAHGMTRNTFVSGEGHSIGVCEDADFIHGMPNKYYRTMYLSPNSTNNSAYLLALRYMLIRETQNANGTPDSLYLADATPRPWLADGKTVSVSGAPTYFGLLSYTISSHLAQGSVDVELDLPSRDPAHNVVLRLRVPDGKRIRSVALNGSPYEKFDASEETINLQGLTGRMKLHVLFTSDVSQAYGK
ncbi:MAG: hypothetical protein ACM3JB_08970 [Acidobacteriaceae bacterium]